MLKLAKTREHTVHTPMNKTWVIITIRIESQQVNDYYPSGPRNITEQYSCHIFFFFFYSVPWIFLSLVTQSWSGTCVRYALYLICIMVWQHAMDTGKPVINVPISHCKNVLRARQASALRGQDSSSYFRLLYLSLSLSQTELKCISM